jgi:hypothetical protein
MSAPGFATVCVSVGKALTPALSPRERELISMAFKS